MFYVRFSVHACICLSLGLFSLTKMPPPPNHFPMQPLIINQGCKYIYIFLLERTFVRLGHHFGWTKEKIGQTSHYFEFVSFYYLHKLSMSILKTESISTNFIKKEDSVHKHLKRRHSLTTWLKTKTL